MADNFLYISIMFYTLFAGMWVYICNIKNQKCNVYELYFEIKQQTRN